MRSLSGYAGKAVRVSLSCLVSVLILELLVRLFLPQYSPDSAPIFVRTSTGVPLGVANSVSRMWKNTGDYDVVVRMNQHGFRDKKRLGDSTPNDILVVGDSFSMGWGVDEEKRYSDLLESRLHVPVYNIAIPGDIDDYRKLVDYAKSNGAQFGRLVIGVCIENDIIDYETRKGLYQPDNPKNSLLQQAKQFLTLHSASYVAITHVFHGSGMLRSLAVNLGWIIPELDAIDRHVYSAKVLDSTVSNLERLAVRSRTTILVIPSRLLWALDNQEAERQVHDRFVALLREKGLTVVDMRPVFEAGGKPMQYHFKNDGHWNDSGHAKAAEGLAASIESEATVRHPE